MFAAANEIWFRLSPDNDAFGLSCGEDGAFLGDVPLLSCAWDEIGRKLWRAQPPADLNLTLTVCYGLAVDFAAKSSGLTVIANALNRGDVALARIAAVQMQLPDLPRIEKGIGSEDRTAKLAFLLRRGGLLKEDWDPEKHPRWPAGSPDGQGGEFAPADESLYDVSADDGSRPKEEASSTQQIAMSPECIEEWTKARAFCGALESKGLLGTDGYYGLGRTVNQCVRGQVSAACGGNPV